MSLAKLAEVPDSTRVTQDNFYLDKDNLNATAKKIYTNLEKIAAALNNIKEDTSKALKNDIFQGDFAKEMTALNKEAKAQATRCANRVKTLKAAIKNDTADDYNNYLEGSLSALTTSVEDLKKELAELKAKYGE